MIRLSNEEIYNIYSGSCIDMKSPTQTNGEV
ncbi:hypothetical protein HMPREF9431_01236 [Segatella oulorum F0390]|uniref:Uncharacterized protein n=1 Tax=Segatella oulorum F0390 TaxID=702438 RepID=G1WBN5_9BACT|nr:hypothetical protein HMPREF9431_01236 [Segatella oulorum F0390]